MVKIVKVEDIQKIPGDHKPYKNRWGNWVWCDPTFSIQLGDQTWPGHKAPEWVETVVHIGGYWYWATLDDVEDAKEQVKIRNKDW